MFGSQIDDIICFEEVTFLKESKKTETNFDSKKRVFGTIQFCGESIEKTNYGYHMNLSKYISTLKELAKEASSNDFRTMQHKLDWTSITNTDIWAIANIMFKVNEDIFSINHILVVNKTVRKLIKTKN